MRHLRGNSDEVAIEDMSFVIHLWLEHGDKRAWRGRITHNDGSHFAFEDSRSLLHFIRDRLRDVSKVGLPVRRSRL